MKKEKKTGFTLVEILVAIAIVAVLATLAIVSLQNARSNARDSKRLADIRQIKTALELFFNDHNRYPSQEEWDNWEIKSSSGSYFMLSKPKAPSPASRNCDSENNEYIYKPSSDGRSYVISFCVGKSFSGLKPGQVCSGPGGFFNCDKETFLCGFSKVADSDGNQYKTIEIGSQCWLESNLKTSNYNSDLGSDKYDNDSMIYAENDYDWYSYGNNQLGAYSIYSYQDVLDCDDSDCVLDKYGALYNWYAVSNYNGICPIGWRVPSLSDWNNLNNFIGDDSSLKLKASSFNNPSWDGSNDYGFLAIPSGMRGVNGNFSGIKDYSYFWTSSLGANNDSWSIGLFSEISNIDLAEMSKSAGLSVRCVKN